jgi:hypothetical protein
LVGPGFNILGKHVIDLAQDGGLELEQQVGIEPVGT